MNRNIDSNTYYGVITLNLKEVMDKKGISIYMLSKKSGVYYDVVKKYYYGKGFSYSLDTLAKFCYVLNCKLEDIAIYKSSFETVYN